VNYNFSEPQVKYKDPCDLATCENNSTCILDPKIKIYICQCLPGFTGKNCEILESSLKLAEKKCDCQNGGSCNHKENKTCICEPDYTGALCEIELDPCRRQPCVHGSCAKGPEASFTCDCLTGFEGLLCEQIVNPCLKSDKVCLNGGECFFDTTCEDNFECKCPKGYTGRQCQTEINECLSSPCLNGGRCLDRLNRYECECLPGFGGNNCQDEIRLLKVKACGGLDCQNNSTCYYQDSNGTVQCVCLSGFYGSRCEKKVLIECENNICLNGGECRFNQEQKTINCICQRG